MSAIVKSAANLAKLNGVFTESRLRSMGFSQALITEAKAVGLLSYQAGTLCTIAPMHRGRCVAKMTEAETGQFAEGDQVVADFEEGEEWAGVIDSVNANNVVGVKNEQGNIKYFNGGDILAAEAVAPAPEVAPEAPVERPVKDSPNARADAAIYTQGEGLGFDSNQPVESDIPGMEKVIHFADAYEQDFVYTAPHGIYEMGLHGDDGNELSFTPAGGNSIVLHQDDGTSDEEELRAIIQQHAAEYAAGSTPPQVQANARQTKLSALSTSLDFARKTPAAPGGPPAPYSLPTESLADTLLQDPRAALDETNPPGQQPPGQEQFMVQMLFSYGWDDAEWQDDDQPLLYNSREEAQAAIDEHCRDCADAVARGDMIDGYDPSEFRVVPVGQGENLVVKLLRTPIVENKFPVGAKVTKMVDNVAVSCVVTAANGSTYQLVSTDGKNTPMSATEAELGATPVDPNDAKKYAELAKVTPETVSNPLA